MIFLVIQDCGQPASIAGGNVDFNLTLNGSIATYTCNEGYNLTGPEVRTCLTDVTQIPGTWSDSPPICTGIFYI